MPVLSALKALLLRALDLAGLVHPALQLALWLCGGAVLLRLAARLAVRLLRALGAAWSYVVLPGPLDMASNRNGGELAAAVFRAHGEGGGGARASCAFALRVCVCGVCMFACCVRCACCVALERFMALRPQA